ncbi:MAG TPA: hypothetical protein LFW21_05365 [Rickettsia endosymbiont of Pyrocoelia pectoralis]|nr:hypothetical protein [Rickettsia endosymbiont of Pyrocoelia pectoralis]
MTLKHENFDSSSEEESKEPYNLSQYLNFLLRNILNTDYISNSEDFKLKLGLTLHNLANGFSKYSSIRDTHKKMKSEILTVDNDSYRQNLNIIKTAFNKHLNKLFTDDNKENPINDMDYKKLFFFLFNPSLTIPKEFTLKKNITADHVKKVLLEELKNSDIDLKTLSKNPLNFTISDSEKFVAFPILIAENNKRVLKHQILDGTNDNFSTICNLPHTKVKTFTSNHVAHYKTGNIQTDIPGFGKYDKILSNFNKEPQYKHAIIKRIFEVIHGKESTQTIEELPRKLNHFAEKLAHLLFIVEIHRNNATLFTAPMFLELIDDTSLIHKGLFPMSTEHAVAQARGILKNYKYVLPNSHLIDYDTTNVQNGNLLLIKEGDLLIKWLSEKLNNSKLANITQIFDILASIKFYQNMDDLKINDIKSFSEKVSKLEHYPVSSLKPLNDILAALLPKIKNIGERNLKLAKTKLLEKKDFPQDLKDLIEITYVEFTESLKNIEEFLAEKQAALKDDIKKLLPEILQILCDKIKEWYNIDAPSYITDTEVAEEKALRDVTLKFTTSPTSSKNKLYFSLKRKNSDDESSYDGSKTLKTNHEASDVNLEEYYKLMRESFSDSIYV